VGAAQVQLASKEQGVDTVGKNELRSSGFSFAPT